MCNPTRRPTDGTVPIIFGTYNIRNGGKGGLESALRGMSQANMDLGILQETKITSVDELGKGIGLLQHLTSLELYLQRTSLISDLYGTTITSVDELGKRIGLLQSLFLPSAAATSSLSRPLQRQKTRSMSSKDSSNCPVFERSASSSG